MEAQIAFSSILNAFGHIELTGDPEWRLDRLNARGLARLPVKVRKES
jgi:cytochrome P450